MVVEAAEQGQLFSYLNAKKKKMWKRKLEVIVSNV